jgi:hypothetical protein
MELESCGTAPIRPDIVKRLTSLETSCINNEAAISKHLEAIESNWVIIFDDDCDGRITTLETVAADVNTWRPKLEGHVDDLRLQFQKVTDIGDRSVFDTSSHRPGAPASSPLVTTDSSSGVTNHIVLTTWVP